MKIRLVAGPDGHVYYDPSGKAQGESLSVDLGELKTPEGQQNIESHLSAKMSDDFWQMFTNQLINRFKTNLSLAKKSGVLVLGTQKVLDGLKNGTVKKVLLAEDAGKDVTTRIQQFEHQYTCLLHTNVYDEALNKSNIVVVGITKPSHAQPLFDTIQIITSMR